MKMSVRRSGKISPVKMPVKRPFAEMSSLEICMEGYRDVFHCITNFLNERDILNLRMTSRGFYGLRILNVTSLDLGEVAHLFSLDIEYKRLTWRHLSVLLKVYPNVISLRGSLITTGFSPLSASESFLRSLRKITMVDLDISRSSMGNKIDPIITSFSGDLEYMSITSIYSRSEDDESGYCMTLTVDKLPLEGYSRSNLNSPVGSPKTSHDRSSLNISPCLEELGNLPERSSLNISSGLEELGNLTYVSSLGGYSFDDTVSGYYIMKMAESMLRKVTGHYNIDKVNVSNCLLYGRTTEEFPLDSFTLVYIDKMLDREKFIHDVEGYLDHEFIHDVGGYLDLNVERMNIDDMIRGKKANRDQERITMSSFIPEVSHVLLIETETQSFYADDEIKAAFID